MLYFLNLLQVLTHLLGDSNWDSGPRSGLDPCWVDDYLQGYWDPLGPNQNSHAYHSLLELGFKYLIVLSKEHVGLLDSYNCVFKDASIGLVVCLKSRDEGNWFKLSVMTNLEEHLRNIVRRYDFLFD